MLCRWAMHVSCGIHSTGRYKASFATDQTVICMIKLIAKALLQCFNPLRLEEVQFQLKLGAGCYGRGTQWQFLADQTGIQMLLHLQVEALASPYCRKKCLLPVGCLPGCPLA